MNPIRNSEAYYEARLNAVQMPGKVVVQGLGDPRNWEVVQGQGTEGASLKYTGTGLPEFTMQVQMWTDAQFDFFESNVRPLLKKPQKGQKPKALDFDSPHAVECDCRRVVVKNVSQLETYDESGLEGYTISLQKWAPLKPVQVLKAKGGDPNDPSKKPGAPLDGQDLLIMELTKQLKDEAAK
ncbi:MAG: hypothetical protein HOW73_34650 [Polyangiaceae bacterium]|nr:hypothetical protein [Polyangiaceae bacterium]